MEGAVLKMYTLYLPSDKNFFLKMKKQSFIVYRGMVEDGGGLRSVQEGYILAWSENGGYLRITRQQILLVACKTVEFLRFSQFSVTRSN